MAGDRCPTAEPCRRALRAARPAATTASARVLSFGQDPRWRRAHGRAHPARRRHACSTSRPGPASSPSGCSPAGHRVTGLDQSPDMLAVGAAAVRRPRRARRGVRDASSPSPTPRSTTSRSRTCCATSTIPAATLHRARPRRPPGRHDRARSSSASRAGSGGRSGISTSASASRSPGGSISQGWYDVGRFLGPSIRAFYERWPLERQLELWREAGIADVRARRMSLGGGVVIWGHATHGEAGVLRAAPGRLARLRDAAAPAVHGLAPLLRRRRRLPRGRGLVGPARAHRARLLPRDGHRRARTRRARGPAAADGDPRRPCSSRSRSSRSPRRARSGSPSRSSFSLWILPLIAIGAFLVPAYNLELFGGRFHSDLWFGACVGRVPGRHRLRRRARAPLRAAAVARRGVGDRPLARPAAALDPGAASAADVVAVDR